MKYRPEIDGLRAFAVVPVLLFHAGFSAFSGGFVGVDVFFVISGYLITTLIAEELHKGTFRLFQFYERRARRILPALVCVILACVPPALILLSPAELVAFAWSLVAVSFFASNIFFWRTTGYFEPSADGIPLLHTWSLAVEEQYYIFFPIFMLLAWRVGVRKLVFLLVLISALSFGLSVWGSQFQPVANFFLAPTRAWELLAGAIGALLVRQGLILNYRLTPDLGLLLILGTVAIYDDTTPFPGIFAIPPVLGSLLIIMSAPAKSVARSLLRSKPIVLTGLISFSLYLWHQPMLAFARLASNEPLSTVQLVSILGACFLLAVFSWRFVEQPLRSRAGSRFVRDRTLTSSALTLSTIAGLGWFGVASDGAEFRFTTDQLKVYDYQNYDQNDLYKIGSCLLTPKHKISDLDKSCWASKTTILWGDSHAAALAPGLRKQLSPISQITYAACPPLVGYESKTHPDCGRFNRYIIERLKSEPPSTVYMHANWLLAAESGTSLTKSLIETINFLKGIGVENVHVLGGVPQFLPNLPVQFVREHRLLEDGLMVPAQLAAVEAQDELIKHALNGETNFIDLLSHLCDGTYCIASISEEEKVELIAWDYGHLTESGSQYVAKLVLHSLSEGVTSN